MQTLSSLHSAVRYLFIKSSGWHKPPIGTHVKSSVHLEREEDAKAWWIDNLGGKKFDLECVTGSRKIPITVEFDAGLPDAYSDSSDEQGKKLSKRLFSAKRAQAMDRILSTISHPKRRLRNYGADLLLEASAKGEHFTVVLKWSDTKKTYGFTSSHFKTIEQVKALQDHQDARKNNGPLQKSEPSCARPSVLKSHYEDGITPTGSKQIDSARARYCGFIVGEIEDFVKAEQFQLIDMPVQVGQTIDKHGHVKQAFTRIQKVRVEKPKQADLFGAPEEPTKKQHSKRLDAFIAKHGGLARMAHLMADMTEGQQQKLFAEMGKLGEKTALEVSAMFDGIKPEAASDDLFAAPAQTKQVEPAKPFATAEERKRLGDLRDTLTDMMATKRVRGEEIPQRWLDKMAEADAVLGVKVAPKDEAKPEVDMTGWTGSQVVGHQLAQEYKQNMYRFSNDAVALGQFKTKLRRAAKLIPEDDEKAVFYIDGLVNKIWGTDYNPKIADIQFKPKAQQEHRYAMVNRPVGIGTVPKDGLIRAEERPARDDAHYEHARNGVAVFNRKLTDAETKNFEMAHMAEGEDREAVADLVAGELQEYAAQYLKQAQNDPERFEQTVRDRIKSTAKGYMPSVGNIAGDFTDLVRDKLKAIVEAKDAGQDHRQSEGYDTPLTVNARALKEAFETENREPLAWSSAKLDATRAGNIEHSSALPELALNEKNGVIGVNDGRHRIAIAAERGESITVLASAQDAEKIKAKLQASIAFGVQAGIGKQARRDLNAQAVSIVNRGAPFTEEDKTILRQYSGNGGCGDSLNEFYTLPEVASAMWSVAQRLGVKGDVLEPSCGPGVYLHTAPADTKVTGVEWDETSAKIAKALHGDRHEIASASLERFATQDERQFDGILGNVPFGLRGSLIKDDKPNWKTADAYFFDTAMDKTKAGGIVGLIVPTGIMDSKTNRRLRETLTRKGQFLGAQRMPNTAFEHSHTEVTTDIVWFRKFPDDVAGALSSKAITQDHLKTLSLWDDEFLSGSYFTGRGAANVLGKMEAGWRAKAGMGADITVEGSMRDVPEAVKAFEAEAQKPFPAVTDILSAVAGDEKAKALVLGGAMNRPYADKSKAGDTKTVDGIAYVLQGKPPRWHRIDEVLQSEALTQGQDIAGRIDALLADATTVDRPKLEADLRAWVEAHGIPSKHKDILLGVKADKTLHRLMGAVKSSGELSDVVLGKVVSQNKGSFETTIQSLLNDHETVGVDALSKAAELDKEAALDQLYGSHRYALDPASGEWTIQDIYLSGNLYDKLDAANSVLNSGEPLTPETRKKLEQQAVMLNEAIAPSSLEDVFIQLNSAFIPTSVVSAFLDQRYKAHYTYDKNSEAVVLEFGEGVYTISGGSNWAYSNLLKYLNRNGLRKDDQPAIDEMNVEFKDWLCASPEYREQVENLYNRKFNGFKEREFSNEPMSIPGMVTEGIKDYQWGTLRWALNAGKGIIANDVGLGKTMVGLMLAKTMRSTGQARRPMIVCPKSVLANWMAECEKWFPGSKVMAIGLEGDTETVRNQKLHDLQQNDYDFILCSEPSFEAIDLDPIIKGEINDRDFWNQRGKQLDKAKSKAQEKIKTQWEQALAGQTFNEDKRTRAAYFNELGIDAVIADEMHHVKNLTALRSRFGETPKFMGGSGLSMRALDFNHKAQWLRQQNDGKNVYGLTATPIKNSPLEIYAMMSHVAPELMENIGIRNSEEFIDRFALLGRDMVSDTSGKIEEALITAGFQNMDELRTVMKRCIRRKTAKDVGLKLPERQDVSHMVDMDEAQKAKYVEFRELLKETSQKDATGDSHVFSIMDKMNKTAADLGLLDDSYDSAKSPKYVECAKTIVQNLKDGGQIIFSDYNDSHEKIADALVAAGIPRNQIGILNGAKTPSSVQRQKMTDQFNAGKLKVVIGNTAVMGEGLNLQKGTSDIHHLDLPWEPASMQQRNGRGLRQGNTNLGVRIHTYLAKGSFDGYRLQSILAKKDIQDMLWNGDDKMENLNRRGNISQEELMIMMAADPDQAREAFELNHKAKEERLIAGKTIDAAQRFAKFQELKRGYAALSNKDNQSAMRLKAKLDKEYSVLKADKYFPAKQALDIDTPVIVASSGIMLHNGAGIQVGDERYIVTGVNQRSQSVTVRGYGDESQSKREMDVKGMISPQAFAYNPEEETAEINKRIAERPLVIKTLGDVNKLPAAVITANYDKLQTQLWEGFKNYSISGGYGQKIPMLNKETGKPELVDSYSIKGTITGKNDVSPETHDFLLPTAEHKAKVNDAWMEARRTATLGTKYTTSGKGRSQKSITTAARHFGSSLVNANEWARTVDDFSGEFTDGRYHYGSGMSGPVKALRAKFDAEQIDRVRHAKTFAGALDAAASLGSITNPADGHSAKVKMPKRVMALLWARARHEGVLGLPMSQHNTRHGGYYVGGGARSVHSALLQMAVNSGHEDLVHAMVESGLRHHKDGNHSEALQVLAEGHNHSKDRVAAMQKLADKAGLTHTPRSALPYEWAVRNGPLVRAPNNGYGYASQNSNQTIGETLELMMPKDNEVKA